jgi:hypothetical protein
MADVDEAKPDNAKKFSHKDFTIREASETERARSRASRYGNQYYPVDESYDKRVYENTPMVWVQIVFALLGFWLVATLHWWAVLEFGIANSQALMIYSFCCFGFTVIFGICLLISGKYANAKKRKHEFLNLKITMFKNEEQDAITREKQDREYKEKKAKQQAEMERIAREEAQKDAEAGAPTLSAPQLVTNIQDPPIAMAPSADADAGKLIDTGSRQ